MYFKILKKDLKRKKSINCILLIFIMLATTFIAGSVNNLTVVLGGMDYFMDRAEVSDFIIVSTVGGSRAEPSENDRSIEAFLAGNKNVTDYGVDDILYAADEQFSTEEDKKLTLNGSIIINSFHIRQQKFFDEDNNEITELEDGFIYMKKECSLRK